MKLKNKIFLILGIFFIVLLGIITNSYCAVEYEMSDGNKVTFENPPNDGNPDYFIFHVNSKNVGEWYYYFTYNSSSGRLGCVNKDTMRFVFLDSEGSYNSGLNIYRIQASKLNGEFESHQLNQSTFNWGSPAISTYSSKEIYKCIESGIKYVFTDELVFQGAPLAQMVTPMEVGKVEELPTLIIQIVEMIIPAFLIIFGTLLVLYLIKSKNLLQL